MEITMNNVKTRMYNAFGPTVILLPPRGTDFERWSVFDFRETPNCTEQIEKVERFIGEAPSALHCNVPQARLRSLVPSQTVRVNTAMRNYLYNYIESVPFGMTAVERTGADGKTRRSIVCALDLDEYDYKPEADAPVRCGENIDIKLVDSRVHIRAGAPIEFSCAVILLDGERKVTDGVTHDSRPLYDFSLYDCGDRIVGYGIDADECERLREEISSLTPDRIKVAVGQNELAAAKEWWEYVKKNLPESEKKTHAARYALVELADLADGDVYGDIRYCVEARRLKNDGELTV